MKPVTIPIAPIQWRYAPAAVYLDAVNARLRARFGLTAAALFAESAVRAAQLAGYTPQQCVDWLASVEGL